MNFELKQTGAYGNRNGNAKLNAEKVRAIRHSRGKITQQELADIYGVSKSVICKVQKRQIWRHVR